MAAEKFYNRRKDPSFWKKDRPECNCGTLALDATTWVSPYDNDDDYTDDYRCMLMEDMYDEGFSKETIMETILMLDQQSLLRACPWIEPVLKSEIKPEDRIVAYRLFIDEDSLENGEVDDDYHFRVRINGFWFEKCGGGPVRFCGTKFDEEPWEVSSYLIYDSDICYFRFKE